jgi:hypothetical protein
MARPLACLQAKQHIHGVLEFRQQFDVLQHKFNLQHLLQQPAAAEPQVTTSDAAPTAAAAAAAAAATLEGLATEAICMLLRR